MKLSELIQEMTMVAGSMEPQLAQYFEALTKDDHSQYSHVGDIEHINVLHKDTIYLLKQEDNLIGFFQVIPTSGTALLQNMYVIPSMRQKGIFSMFLFFLKRNENYSKIQLGSVHSQDTINAVKRISSRFNIHWEKNGETKPYTPDTIKQFYGLTKETGWNIILENDGEFSSWPKFHSPTELDNKSWYSWLLDTKQGIL